MGLLIRIKIKIGESEKIMKKVFIKDNMKFECDINYFYSGSKINLLVNGKETKRMIKSDRNKLFFIYRENKIFYEDFQ